MKRNPRNLNAKAILASFAASFALSGYLAYYFYLSLYGIKLNELYFIITCVPISMFTGMLFTFFENRITKTILLYASVYYGIMAVMYIGSWILLKQPYGYIKISLIIGLIVGLIYWVYDYTTNSEHRMEPHV